MSPDPYEIALRELVVLQSKYDRTSVMVLANKDAGVLLGFALDSETLKPQAIIESDDLDLIAIPAAEIIRAGDRRAVAGDHFAHDRLSHVRHRKGGNYTRVGPVLRGKEELILYISHNDSIWWVRPRSMFEDGRFETVDAAPSALPEVK